MGKWTSSPHPISDIRDWKKEGKLEIQPDFQRRAVWSDQAKILLIDSILKGIPMPKLFIAQKIKDSKTYRVVIDGQQRISAILDFLDNKFSLNKPYKGPHENKFFKDLNEEEQNEFLLYNLDFNIINGYSDEEIREMYHRVNKYNVALNKQELRRADFPGDFLRISEELSSLDFFENARIFTTANRRRLGDVEYTSELLTILIAGPQDKKNTLDNFYIDYADWAKDDLNKIKSRFTYIIKDIETIFSYGTPIQNTRFRQKSDFYSLFASINNLHEAKKTINQDLLSFLREDFDVLDIFIEPSSDGLFGEYAVKCLSDANSIGSRKWRIEFIQNILSGAYSYETSSPYRLTFLSSLIKEINFTPMCNSNPEENCIACNETVDRYDEDVIWAWDKERIFLSTAGLARISCLQKHLNDYVWQND